MTFFGEKFPFSRQNFLMTFFLSSTRFLRFSLSFPRFSLSFSMLNVIFDPFLTRKTPFFTLFVLSRASYNTTSLNIGGTMHGLSPNLKFLGRPSPQFPLGLRPCGGVKNGRAKWTVKEYC